MITKVLGVRTYADRAITLQKVIARRWAQVFDTGAWLIFEDGELRLEVESENCAGREAALRHVDEIDAFVRSY